MGTCLIEFRSSERREMGGAKTINISLLRSENRGRTTQTGDFNYGAC